MAWTKEQTSAIELDGNNIIVSAGAGSGKTAVLTERVLRKMKDGVHINELLIMTFTNAAAKEMKDRIRKKLTKENLKEELDLIDSAYITTFDSFSLSIVKKYHYLLNLPKKIGITDNSILSIEKDKIMNEIFDSYYESDNEQFKQFIKDFCYKDDDGIKKLLIKLNDKIDMKIDREEYLENYISNYYSDKYINDSINSFFGIIKETITNLENDINKLSLYLDGDYIGKMHQALDNLLNATCYDEVVTSLGFKLPPLPKNQENDVKVIKKEITEILTNIKKICIYSNEEEIIKEIKATLPNTKVIIEILTRFNNQLKTNKLENNIYSFNDISKLAIRILEENQEVVDELKTKFNEIMVDEYQDTNDVQEYFIKLISKNNVYMVGDIKQSIYRFRNANPHIFKNKYDLYTNTSDGIKIDLLKNFRSREEVLSNINLMFDNLMFDDLGGADYKNAHQMIFGNSTYNEEGKTQQDYDFELLLYDDVKDGFTNCEKEIFIIGNDIKNKVENHYQIFDKDEKTLHDATYNDFVILLDRATDFELYKKVFEYLNVPLALYKDEEIKSESDILIIKNILKIEQAIDKEKYDKEFKYAFLSLGRSFLFNMDDEELFHILKTETYKDTLIYKKCEELYNYYYETTPKVLFLKLLEIFNYEENLLKLNNITTARVRLEYFYNLLDNFANDGKTIEEFIEYLDVIFDSDEKTTFSSNTNYLNSVKIMTIHKSKGLEYPICYFAGFTKKFSFKELNDPILYSNKYGLITPYFDLCQKDTIYKLLLKKDTQDEELSEKIRLLYVAVTRAKEKMIVVMPKPDEEKIDYEPSTYKRNKMTSFLDMMHYIYGYVEKYAKSVEAICTKKYLINKNNLDNEKLKEIDDLKIETLTFEKKVLEENHYSKSTIKLNSKEDIDKMKFGTSIHEKLELINFKNPDYSSLSELEKTKIEAFINSPFVQENLDAKFYKEYEFIYQTDDEIKTGIIDLMIECDNKIIIIDYKLKNVDDDAYILQLTGYKTAISKRTNKKIELYLYSILDEKFKPIN